MFAPDKPTNIRDQMLLLSTKIYQKQLIAPAGDQDLSVVWWANTLNFDPGLGVLTRLDRPFGAIGAKTLKSLFISYDLKGESSIIVDSSVGVEEYQDDGLVSHIKDVFIGQLGVNGENLSGKTLSIENAKLNPFNYFNTQKSLDAAHQADLEPQLHILPSQREPGVTRPYCEPVKLWIPSQ